MGTKRQVILVAVLLALCSVALADEAVATKNFNEGVTAPYLIPGSRVSPEYPAAAFDARIEGQVTVAALVLKDGSVSHAEALDSSAPNLGFESAATKAVRHWRFEPAEHEGKAIDAFAVVRLSFRRTAGASAYVSAGFVPLEMLGASIIADIPAPAAGAGNLGTTMAGAMDPERGAYHPRIPPGLFPGGSYEARDWWPARDRNIGDSRPDSPNFDVSKK